MLAWRDSPKTKSLLLLLLFTCVWLSRQIYPKEMEGGEEYTTCGVSIIRTIEWARYTV